MRLILIRNLRGGHLCTICFFRLNMTHVMRQQVAAVFYGRPLIFGANELQTKLKNDKVGRYLGQS